MRSHEKIQPPPIVAPPVVAPPIVAPSMMMDKLACRSACPTEANGGDSLSRVPERLRGSTFAFLGLLAGLSLGYLLWHKREPKAMMAQATPVLAEQQTPMVILPELRSEVAEIPDVISQPKVADDLIDARSEPASTMAVRSVVADREAVDQEIAASGDTPEPELVVANTAAVEEVAAETELLPEIETLVEKETTLVNLAEPDSTSDIIRSVFKSPTGMVKATDDENEQVCKTKTCPSASLASLNTSLKWTDTPAEAYKLAQEQDKLVFLIHVSGNFKIPGFT